MFIIKSVCPWRAFPVLSTNIFEYNHHLPEVRSKLKRNLQLLNFYSTGHWPYPQTLHKAGKACQAQKLYLIKTLINYGNKFFYNIDTCSGDFG